jgi:hypothetical protein
VSRYLVRIGGVSRWVGETEAIDVGIVQQKAQGLAVEWIGKRSWFELAGDGRMLVTPGANGELLEVWCPMAAASEPQALGDDLEEGALSSREAQIIVATLKDSGQLELASRIEKILDRLTRTDSPPAAPTLVGEEPKR